ncbi:DNA topoisomerase 1 [Candidatus Nitrosocosmicus franklandus]|uniref:DNA topoisomerase n=1 Tax=Candidatus Nitrosocosmicus franklandianus TaxID=1798806 RepID=A0A484I9N8_9ARCH|nr:DNA topoisomerase 1 [Candidatus Nitrosocosmicus franklandus]
MSIVGPKSKLSSINTVQVKNLSQSKGVLDNDIFFNVNVDSNQKYIICYALGHLYGLSDTKGSEQEFPILYPSWQALSWSRNQSIKSKSLTYKIKRIIDELSKLSKVATNFIHACDYDQEGEVIGYNILQYACKNKYSVSKRAKFSSLTDEEIRNSFSNLLPPNHNLKDAGLSRHLIDYIYGINLSRALTNSVKRKSNEKNTKKFITLSIGRVQGPTLAFVVEREKEILDHISTPYWNILAVFQKNDRTLKAYYFPQKIESKDLALSIVAECKNQLGKVTDVLTNKTAIKQPYPFNIGDLQKEAYRVFKFSPNYTLSVAEKLYLDALISYPRTSSQKLPPSINYTKIISNISKMAGGLKQDPYVEKTENKNVLCYSVIVSNLLAQKSLIPNEGKQDDPAHPAIYPTGQKSKRVLDESESKLLDLIVRRFFATFGKEAFYQQVSVTIAIKDKYIFKSEEKKIISEGWIEFYRPYFDYSGYVTTDTLSFLKKDDILKIVNIESIEKTTQPPPRFNQSTLLQKMEREKIGTKATRSEIINTLFKRNYIYNFSTANDSKSNRYAPPLKKNTATWSEMKADKKPAIITPSESIQNVRLQNDPIRIKGSSGIRPTEMGIALVESMKKYVPNIVSTSLTRTMEEQLEQIESGKKPSSSVVDQAREQVREAVKSFSDNEDHIAEEISQSLQKDRRMESISNKSRTTVSLGACPVCQKGKLIVKKSTKTRKRFAGCTNYSSSNCTATAPLPSTGALRGLKKICNECKWPIVASTGTNQGKRYRWQFCINPQCPLKKTKK